MYSRSSIHLIGKLSLVWDTFGTVHITPRDLNIERNQDITKVLFEKRRSMINELKEKAEAHKAGEGIDIFA